MNKKLIIILILVSIAAYAAFVEIDNYFNGGLHDTPRNMQDLEREIESKNTPDDLKGIFGNCNCQEDPERTCEQTLIVWQNSTHYIDNNLCQYITLDEYYD